MIKVMRKQGTLGDRVLLVEIEARTEHRIRKPNLQRI